MTGKKKNIYIRLHVYRSGDLQGKFYVPLRSYMYEYVGFSPNLPPNYIRKRVLRPKPPGDASVITYRFGRVCGIVGFVLFITFLDSYLTYIQVIN